MEKSPYELIHSFDETLWRQGLEALVVEHSPASVEAIFGLLSDKAWRKREAAAKSLVEWGPEIIPVLLPRLNAQNPDEFYWILYIIGHFDDPLGRAKIRDFLNHSDPEIRGYAVRALSICTSPVNAQILYPLLNDNNWAVRKLTFERLLAFGDTILDDLRKLLATTRDDPNHPVVALFVKLGRESVLPELGQYYQTGSFSMRYSIISALGEDASSNAAVDFLVNGLSDQSWVIRKRAAELLTAIGPRVFDRLSAWFGRGDSLMKHQIVNIIVELLGERSLPLIRRLLSSNEQEYRILAVESLSRLPGDEPARLLIKCLSDQQRIVSDYASDCLARKTNLNLELLLEHLSTDDENLRFLVIKTIGSIGGLALNPIIRILEEGNKQERLFLLGVLQRIAPNQKLIDALITLLGDPNWPVRNATAGCLRSYGEMAVPAVVRVLNSPSEDIQYWARRVLLSLGPSAVTVLTGILDEGTDGSLIPHIISALLAMDNADAVPAVVKFLQKSDDNRIDSVFSGIGEIASREVVDNLLNLMTHPDERIARWLAFLLRKVRKPVLKRSVLLGLNHPNEQCRSYVLEAVRHWGNLTEAELKTLIRQLEVEKTRRNIQLAAEVLAGYPLPFTIFAAKEYLKSCDADLMLDLMLIFASPDHQGFGLMLAELLKTRSEIIKVEDIERVGKVLGLIFKTRPEGILQGLSSPSMAYRLCCVVALEQIDDKRVAFALMDNLNTRDAPDVIQRAVKILARYFFSEDFRLKGAVTDFLLSLGMVIVKPLSEYAATIENDIDRKALVDLIESVGGTVDQALLRKKGEQKVVLSDDHLDNVLERRKQAMAELEKYDRIIQEAHTLDLTIMFTDVKGYTAFSSKASLSEVMSMLKQHDEILVPIFEKHAGKVIKKIGDAFLVVFEQAPKALLAGINIQRQLQTYNATVPEERKLSIRVAINTGSVICRENDIFGDAVNVAARLEGVADAGEIVISEATAGKVDATIFELVPYGEHKLKGIEKPVKTFRVTW
ncbi:MAG TPA: HEAT repeat domain-containing protein [Candidatus Ozemobacteraceae bacterium]|nr:HEAT repeat domain-containing protein [Candidatus Ozemobacteraceae bacterium]